MEISMGKIMNRYESNREHHGPTPTQPRPSPGPCRARPRPESRTGRCPTHRVFCTFRLCLCFPQTVLVACELTGFALNIGHTNVLNL